MNPLRSRSSLFFRLLTFVLFGWFAAALAATVSSAEETEPTAIFKKVTAVYEAMETFSGEGTIVSDIDTRGMKLKMETSFSVKLKKPNMYLISWSLKSAPVPARSQLSAVWSDGTQPYLYSGGSKTYSKENGDEMALAGATGISGGAAFTIPSLFLPAFEKRQPSRFSKLLGAKLTGIEQAGGEDCFVISGSSAFSTNETFWISKSDYMIRRYSRSYERPKGAPSPPKMTNEQMEDSLRAMGEAVTPKNMDVMRKMLQQAADAVKTADLKGTSTESYTEVGSPQLSQGDFAFKVPAGVVLKDSQFGGTFK